MDPEDSQMDSWEGPMGPLLKTRSGLSSLAIAASANSDEDERYERSRKTSTQMRGIKAMSRKPKEAAPHYYPYKTAEAAIASPHGMARRCSITTSFSRTNSAGDFFPSQTPSLCRHTSAPTHIPEGPLIKRTASIARTGSFERTSSIAWSVTSSASTSVGSTRRGSVSDAASLVHAVSGTLEEILAMGVIGREACIAHKTPMRSRPIRRPQRPVIVEEFSRVSGKV